MTEHIAPTQALKYQPLLDAAHKASIPYKDDLRLVGFVLPGEVAGLSDGLFMLDGLVEAARIAAERTASAEPAPSADVGELVEALRAVEGAMLRGADGNNLPSGWNITALNAARPKILAALAKHGGAA